MAKTEREKGKRGEREVAAMLREFGFPGRRTAQYCGSTQESADVVGLPGIHVEVKRQERASVYEWYAQAERDAGEDVPVVVFRRSRGKWMALMDMRDFLRILKGCENGER